MRFLWPSALLLFGLIPLLVGFYLWSLRRRKVAVRYSSLSLIRAALPEQSRWRRHLPFAIFLLSLSALILAFSRPVTVTLVPSGRATIVLAMDVSRSMLQVDISPSRLEAAKNAALSFITRQKATNQIGIVAFAGFAQLIQPPTTDQEELQSAILGLTTGRGTAIGSGLVEAINTIAEINPNVAAIATGPASAGEPQATPVPEGSYAPDIVVLLTDGVNTTGAEPLAAAQAAVERGVRVYTIGFGSMNVDTWQGGNAFGGGRFRHGIDEATLKEVAAMTGGEYYAASSAGELQKVFESLPTYLMTREETTEIGFLFIAAGIIFVAAAVLLAQLWRPLG